MEKLIVTLTVSELRSIIQDAIELKLKGHSPHQEKSINEKDPLPQLVTRKEVARLFKVSLVSIDKWRKYGLLPKSIKQSGKTYFLRNEILSFLKKKSTSTDHNSI